MSTERFELIALAILVWKGLKREILDLGWHQQGGGW